jgi:hypothetical protein
MTARSAASSTAVTIFQAFRHQSSITSIITHHVQAHAQANRQNLPQQERPRKYCAQVLCSSLTLQGFSPSLQRARKPFLVPNIIVGSLVCLFAGSVYVYSISAVKQDDFVSQRFQCGSLTDFSPTWKTCYRLWNNVKTPVRLRTTCAIPVCRHWGRPWTHRYNLQIRRRRYRNLCRFLRGSWGTCRGGCRISIG